MIVKELRYLRFLVLVFVCCALHAKSDRLSSSTLEKKIQSQDKRTVCVFLLQGSFCIKLWLTLTTTSIAIY